MLIDNVRNVKFLLMKNNILLIILTQTISFWLKYLKDTQSIMVENKLPLFPLADDKVILVDSL